MKATMIVFIQWLKIICVQLIQGAIDTSFEVLAFVLVCNSACMVHRQNYIGSYMIFYKKKKKKYRIAIMIFLILS